jgi:hypothetical protein
MKKTTFITLILLILSVNGIYACSCIKSNIKKGFNNSDLIFTGKVVDVNEKILKDSILTENGKFYVREYRRIEFKFKVSEFIKGKNKTEFITVTTTGGGADCGNYFKLNTEHLVYSYETDIKLNSFDENAKTEPYFTTSICTRTKDLNRTKKREILKLKRLAKRKK